MRPLRFFLLLVHLAMLVAVVSWCTLQTPPQPVPTDMPTRLPITVLPTVFVFSTPTPVDVFTAPSPGVGDLLPMTPATRLPTATPAPPTETPSKPPVQRGMIDDTRGYR